MLDRLGLGAYGTFKGEARLCGCHIEKGADKTELWKISPQGVGAAASTPTRPTGGLAAHRHERKRLANLSPEGQLLEAANAELKLLRKRVALSPPLPLKSPEELAAPMPALRWARVRHDDRRVYLDTKFSSAAHMEAFVDLLCSCQREKLDRLQFFDERRFDKSTGVFSNNRPRLGNYGSSDLTSLDEAYMYFTFENFEGAKQEYLAVHFQVTRQVVIRTIIKWACVTAAARKVI